MIKPTTAAGATSRDTSTWQHCSEEGSRPSSTRASPADQAPRVKVVRPAGRSTLTHGARPTPLAGGSTADEMISGTGLRGCASSYGGSRVTKPRQARCPTAPGASGRLDSSASQDRRRDDTRAGAGHFPARSGRCGRWRTGPAATNSLTPALRIFTLRIAASRRDRSTLNQWHFRSAFGYQGSISKTASATSTAALQPCRRRIRFASF